MPHTNINTLLNFNGSVTIIRASAKNSADGIAVIEHKMPFGYAPPLHVHKTQDEVFHILRGRIRFEVGGKSFIGEAGDILTAPKGVPHRFIVESPGGAHGFTITHGSDFESFVTQSSEPLLMDVQGALSAPTAKDLERVAKAAANSNIDLLGPPMAA
jgi:mannose-6-phosphate isomerase-like protein (cupin superfamily)